MNKRGFLKTATAASAAVVLSAVKSGHAQDVVNVLVTFHSVTGNTEKMAQGVADGAKTIS
jgi:hypothetical protein